MSDNTLLWAGFLLSREKPSNVFGNVVDGGVTRYRVDRAELARGHFRGLAQPGWHLTRVESRAPVASLPCDERLDGVTQHLAYAGATDRVRLAASSRQRPGSLAVLILIRKSPEWWALAPDERQSYMGRVSKRSGHIGIGSGFAERILRRLYHARYLPRSEWDFLTYFEMDARDVAVFRDLLRQLRDPAQNPEWRFVERELEIWTRKV